MAERATRGFGILEVFLAKKRAALAEKLMRSSSRESRILDIGCGSFPYFLTGVDFKERYGVDQVIVSQALRDASITLKQVNIEKEPLPFRDNWFDVVVMLAVFEHVNYHKIDHVLQEIHRVLKKDGRIIITTPSPWADPVLRLLTKVRLVSEEEIHDHKHAMNPEVIMRYLTNAGFSAHRIKRGYFELFFNMWFVARK